MADEVNRLVILGSGPAGLTAALYSSRANLSPLLIEGAEPGGQLTITTEVENYPGFEKGIQGPEMMDVFRRQATRFGTRFLFGAATAVDLRKYPFELTVEKETVVVGGGDTAMEEATFLTRFSTKVTIVHRRDQLRASRIMQDRAFANSRISFVWDSVVDEIYGDRQGGVKGVRFKNVTNDKTTDFRTDGVFMAIGHQPNTAIFQG